MYTADGLWTHNVGEGESKQLVLCVAQTCERKNCTVNSKRVTTRVGVTTVDKEVETAVRTALIYYCIHRGLYPRTVHSVQRCWSTKFCCCAGLAQGDVRMERKSALIQGESIARVPLWTLARVSGKQTQGFLFFLVGGHKPRQTYSQRGDGLTDLWINRSMNLY